MALSRLNKKSLKMIKKCFIIFMVLSGQILSAHAQSLEEIKIDGTYYGNTLNQIFLDISFRYPVQFDYLSEDIPIDIVPGRNYSKKPLKEVMDDLLRLTTLEYIMVEDFIVIRKAGVKVDPEKWRYERKSVFRLTGVIKDKTSGESLPFANVIIKGTKNGTSTNGDGYFTLINVPSDTSVLEVYYVGYKQEEVKLSPRLLSKQLVIEMTPESTELKEIVIEGEREDLLEIPEKANIVSMTPREMSVLPSLGTADIFRTFQLLPGVSGSNESSSGLYVRGGSPDQNLILFDGFTVYHQEHLFGVFSAFNTNAIKDVQLYKGGFESKYGGRISSVMDIIGKTGNEKYFNIGADISMLDFNGFIEIPLHEKGSIFFAGRKSYKGYLYNKLFNTFANDNSTSPQQSTPPPMPSGMGFRGRAFENIEPLSYFYDLNFKATYRTTPKDILSLSFFKGQDNLDNSRDVNRSIPSINVKGGTTDMTKWGNWGSSFKWSHKWKEKFYTNSLISYSNYFSYRDRTSERTFTQNGVETVTKRGSVEDNNIRDFSLKIDNEYNVNEQNLIEAGLLYSFYNIDYTYEMNDTIHILDKHDNGNLAALYFQDKWSPLSKIYFLPGLRVSYFDMTGKLYLEPRVQFSYSPLKKVTLQCAWGNYYQFANRIIREDIMAGSRDFWILSDGGEIPVGQAIHYTLGAKYENKDYILNIEAYYKDLKNLSEYTLRFVPAQSSMEYDTFFYNGKGFARGIEFLLQKKYGLFSGWVGYTLGQVLYNFPIYGNGYFPASHDVTHEFKIIGSYKLKKWVFSGTWIYATGKPYTQPLGGYELTLPDGEVREYILTGVKNSERYPDYHRLDLSAKYAFTLGDMFIGDIGVSIFNLYNRKNVWYKEFEIDDTGMTETNVYLLGFTPNLSIALKIR
ncbi:MAG: TonB-dependent receptor [Bacteroidetes bacterium]|nr:TonB-dependent receptor [Bacteroidota bacterium]